MKFDPNAKKTYSAAEVAEIHKKSDLDSGPKAQHHTIGLKNGQTSDGAHTHDGKNSKLILEGQILSGAKGGSAVLTSIVAALVKLGATDTTT